MEGFNQTFYNLKNLKVRFLTGQVMNIVSLDVQRNDVYDKKWPGQQLVPSQAFIGEDLPDLSAEVHNDELAVFGGIIPNAPLSGFILDSPNDGNAAFLGSDFLSKFPPEGMTFGKPQTNLVGDKISTTKFKINCNVLNPGADGGFPNDL